MTILIPLILTLIAMAAAIAYTGDWLGSVVGKRRLSLFGVRPRQTGRIIGVLAGIAIMLMTVGTLALAFRNAVRVIFNAQDVAAQLRQLEVQTGNLESQVSALQQERDGLSDDLQEAQDTISSAEAETALAVEERDQAQEEFEDLQIQQETLQRSLETLSAEVLRLETQEAELSGQNQSLTALNRKLLEENAQVQAANDLLQEAITERNLVLNQLAEQGDGLRDELEASAEELEEAEFQLEAVGDNDLTYSRNELVDTGVLSAQDAAGLRAELAQLLQGANEATGLRRAGRVELLPEQLESLVAEALQTPGEDIVTLRSAGNHFSTEPVVVLIESSENRKLVDDGQLVISGQLHLGTPELPAEGERLRSALLRLQREARDRLLGMGLSDAVNPVLSQDSFEVDGFTDQLLRLSGPVTVGLSAVTDIYSSGPAELEFVIIN